MVREQSSYEERQKNNMDLQKDALEESKKEQVSFWKIVKDNDKKVITPVEE